MLKLLLIFLGGGLGALLRYGLSGWTQRMAPDALAGLPVGTLAVNVVGCLAIGVIGAILAGPYLVREEHRAFVLVGVLGALTTFSTFGWETFELINEREWGLAGANILANNLLCLAGVWIGYRLTEHLAGA